MQKLRRYTNIPSLIDIILNKSLTLLDPRSWTDKNDVYVMDQYKEHSKKGIKTLRALCFTEAKSEVFHHWNVFAGDSSGVCIIFNKDALIDSVKGIDAIRHRSVTYISSEDESTQHHIEDIPFLKRGGYEDEQEYRFIYEDAIDIKAHVGFGIDLSCIEEIIFSPRTPPLLVRSVKETISKMETMKDLMIPMDKSSLTDDFAWKSKIDCVINPGTVPSDYHFKHIINGL